MRACWRRSRAIWLACRCDHLQSLASAACHGVGCCSGTVFTHTLHKASVRRGWHHRRVPCAVKVKYLSVYKA